MINDSVGIDVDGSGCTAIDTHSVECGAFSDYDLVVLTFGDGDDTFSAFGRLPIEVTASGGGGADELVAGEVEVVAHAVWASTSSAK